MLVIPDDFHPGKWQRITKMTTALVKSKYKIDKTYDYPVTLVWGYRPSTEKWNEICAWTVEHLGLPGHRYRTEITTEKMTWFFETVEDQLIFTLAWGNDDGIDI